MSSEQEKADEKLLLHAKDAVDCDAKNIHIFRPDTNVLISAIRRYPELCLDTNFVTRVGEHRRTIKVGDIYSALGPSIADALPGLHSLSGCDTTGCFAGKAKVSFWNIFCQANNSMISALGALGTSSGLDDENCAALEAFICRVNNTQTSISKVSQLRWWMFMKKQVESGKLPPTSAALKQAILHAHYQAIVWYNDTIAHPNIPSPERCGWTLEEDGWTPIMTTQLPAPESVLQLGKCGCKTKCQSKRCSSQRAGLPCTDICCCSDEENPCENVLKDTDNTEDDENMDEEALVYF